MSRKKNSRKKATVDLRVQNSRMVVKMNQPCRLLADVADRGRETHHQEQTEGIVEHGGSAVVSLDNSRLDVETTGGQDDSEGDPETTIRGQSSGTKSVTDSHFPEKTM